MTTMKTSEIAIEANVRIGELNLPDSFVSSIAKVGIIQPLVVDEKGTLIAGHRRLAAAKKLGLAEVPVHVRATNGSGGNVVAVQFTENVQREDLSAWEQAQAVLTLKDEGMKHAEVAEALSIPTKEVSELWKAAKVDLTDEQGRQFTLDGLVNMADAVRETGLEASDLAQVMIDGRASGLRDAVRRVRNEVREAEIVTELGKLLGEWAELGIKVVYEPPNLTDVKDQWGRFKEDPNIKRLVENEWQNGVYVPLTEHIKEPCHVVEVIAQHEYGYGHTEWRHWCNDAKRHKKAGKSELKVPPKSTNSMDEATKKQRAADRVAKNTRRTKAGIFLTKGTTNKGYRYEVARKFALASEWREDILRATVLALVDAGAIEKRPKGAEYNWYQKQFEAYAEGRFGKDWRKSDAFLDWKLACLVAGTWIERDEWNVTRGIVDPLKETEIPDAEA